MGIPKFYRWISERYPCLSEKIREYQIPEFDNLYLDMNGIIHSCSHPNDEDIHLRIPEKDIFNDIFQYIDFLFKMIKPRKTFLMAVDGVAPRAKMNQQRGRRFRSAKLAEDQEAEALRKGETLPAEERFDSNCITPGTEFMARLHIQLQYFVKVKVSTDPLWQRKGLTVILSGHNVPGEGEHKIMDYIRYIRSQPDYDPDTRHCLYGLDADLIMLGLSTHELRFSLLREEVKFSQKKDKKGDWKRKPRQKIAFVPANVSVQEVHVTGSGVNGCLSYSAVLQKEPPPALVEELKENEPPPSDDKNARGTYRPPIPEKTTFLLLHLSLLRDYIDEEFQGLKHNLEGHPTIKYDLEKVIDDWILLSVLIGNDFIPHLPMLHIVKGAFPMLYTTYASLLPKLDGYINENGVLNLSRIETFLATLSAFDLEVFKETYEDMKYMESKTGKNIVLGDKMFGPFEMEEDDTEEDEISCSELQALIARTEAELEKTGFQNGGGTSSEFFVPSSFFDAEDSPEFRVEFLQYKRNYYMEKLGMKEVTKDNIKAMAEEYIRAIQWILSYYYKGVSSWGWYYPHHYAPFCSDIHHITTFNMEFIKGTPFRPFEQLLGVLPSQSGKLLPKCFHDLMINEESPILDFYPKDFENDLNGKRNDWEAVVLIPFIDEKRLLNAMEQKALLSDEEANRNSRGVMHFYRYRNEDGEEVRSLGDSFPPLAVSHFSEEGVTDMNYNKELLPKGLHPKARQGTIYQGFPTLKSIPHSSELKREEIKIFDFPTREESMVLTLLSDPTRPSLAELAKKLLGKTVWVNWPHLTYALVIGISDKNEKLIRKHDGPNAPIISDQSRYYNSSAKILTERHLKYKGIVLNGCQIIIWAKTMEGRKFVPDKRGGVIVDTQWSQFENSFALETTIHTEDVQEAFLGIEIPKFYSELFSPGDTVVCTDFNFFGCIGTIHSPFNRKQHNFTVFIDFPQYGEGKIENALATNTFKSREYYTCYEVASMLSLPSILIAKLTGTIFVSFQTPKNNNNRNRKGGSTGFQNEETKTWKENIALNLKFNKRNLEVRGYSRKTDNQWVYSLRAVQLIQEYAEIFPEVVYFIGRSDSSESRDFYTIEEIFPEKPQEKMKSVLDWIDEKGIRQLPQVPLNSKVLDDDDVTRVWELVADHQIGLKKGRKIVHLPPQDLYKPGLNRGCVGLEDKWLEFRVLDRVVCIDPSGPLPLGHRGTIIGVQNPHEEERQEEEAFRSTSATILKTLVVLADPKSPRPRSDSKTDDIRSALLSVLKIGGKKEVLPMDDKPKLLIFYPFQLLNLSNHARKKSTTLQQFWRPKRMAANFGPPLLQ